MITMVIKYYLKTKKMNNITMLRRMRLMTKHNQKNLKWTKIMMMMHTMISYIRMNRKQLRLRGR